MTATMDPLTFDLADRLRKAREIHGWDIGEMADRLGVSRGSVSGWERRKHYPHHKNLRDYATVTGVPLWWLLAEDPGRTDAPHTHDYDTDRILTRRRVALAA